MLKRVTFLIMSLLLCLLFFSFSVVGAETALPEISAEAAVLLDWNSSRILYARNPHLPRPMASTTKIMTAVVALERGILDNEVITSPRAANTGGSSIWLEEGEVKTLEELLLGLMLRSGNDAAVAIAEHISGSVENFAELMTERARELGARNTSFRNPHGLHHPEHYTTAYDLALISAHGMGIKEFRRIISTPSTVISWPGHPWDRFLYNQNKLFTLYQGAEGIKTGWTTPAGRCFAGAAVRSGHRLISVVLNAPRLWEDTVALLDYGFTGFQYRCLVEEGQYLKSVAVVDGESDKVEALASRSFCYPLRTLEDNEVTYRFIINEPVKAPLKAGERIGELEICFQQEVVGLIDLLAGHEVKKIGFFERLKRKLGRRE
jgi:D-alanyl-D-alanine carboxypeptidase (penicillin-binding protein 5/6)